MRVLLIILGAFFLAGSCKSKTADTSADEQEIRNIFEKMNDFIRNEKYEDAVAFIHPGSFETFTADEMIQGLKASMHTPEYDVQIKKFIIDSVSGIYPSGTEKYALMQHRTQASFAIKIDSSADAETQATMMNTFCTNMKSGIGEENVTCHIPEKRLDIVMRDKTYFIYSAEHKKWLAVSGSNTTAIDKLIPAEIKEKLIR
jgi:hypothetical protein